MRQHALWLPLLLIAGCNSAGPTPADPDGQPDGDGPSADARTSDAPTPTPLSALSDEFDGDSLDTTWLLHRGERIGVGVSGGELNVVLEQGHGGSGDSSLWFNNDQGSALFKRVSGDFIATAAIRVRRADPNADQAPLPSVRLGGLMARDESSASENYVFVVTGQDVDDLSVETKNTDGGSSQFVGPTTGRSDSELRLCRVGTSFRMYHRAIGGTTWQLAAVPPPPGSPGAVERPDLPQTLQVALILYTNQATPDVQMFVDYVRLRRPASAADCSVD